MKDSVSKKEQQQETISRRSEGEGKKKGKRKEVFPFT